VVGDTLKSTHQLKQVLQMIRFSHTLFALPFALIAALLAWSVPSPLDPLGSARPLGNFRWQELLGILLCMVTARSVAMAFNRIADCDIDAQNPRTANRHLPTGALRMSAVVSFAIAMAVAFVLSTLLFLPSQWPLRLAIPVLVFICFYSYTKRFTSTSHFWLGAALMLAPICTWIALRGEWLSTFPADLLPSVVLGAAVMLWVTGFDLVYACQDVDFDRQRGLHSIPQQFGVSGALRLAAICHFGTVILLVALPWICPQTRLGWIYVAGVGLIAALLVYEHSIVKTENLDKVNVAFFNVNAIVSVGLLAIVALDMVVGR
jgi:4-hydroxybenzoate polyprenyltransferase